MLLDRFFLVAIPSGRAAAGIQRPTLSNNRQWGG